MEPSKALITLGKLLSLHSNGTDLGDGQMIGSHVVVASCNWSALPQHLIETPYFSAKKPLMRKLKQQVSNNNNSNNKSISASSFDLDSMVLHLQKQAAVLIGGSDDEDNENLSNLPIPNADVHFDEVGIDSLLTIE